MLLFQLSNLCEESIHPYYIVYINLLITKASLWRFTRAAFHMQEVSGRVMPPGPRPGPFPWLPSSLEAPLGCCLPSLRHKVPSPPCFLPELCSSTTHTKYLLVPTQCHCISSSSSKEGLLQASLTSVQLQFCP